MQPEVTENLVDASSTDFIRSRAMTGKPARQFRSAWVDAWEREDAPDTLPMPIQGLLFGEYSRRWSRVHSKEYGGHPAGQIIGSIDKVRPARDMVLDMVQGWIDTVERFDKQLEAAVEACRLDMAGGLAMLPRMEPSKSMMAALTQFSSKSLV